MEKAKVQRLRNLPTDNIVSVWGEFEPTDIYYK